MEKSIIAVHPASHIIRHEVSVPFSKPHMQRAIVLSLLTNAPSAIVHPAWSSEATSLFAAACHLGLSVKHQDADRLIVDGAGRSLRRSRFPLHVEGSAFNLRALVALACLSPGETIIQGNASLLARPVIGHLGFLRDLGCEVTDRSEGGQFRIAIRGNPRLGGAVALDAKHSSQLLTSLLLISPLAASPITVSCADHVIVSEGYVDLTVSMMQQQGAVVETDSGRFTVAPTVYQTRIHHLPSDFTALSYLAGMVLTAADAEIVVNDYYPSTLTSERQFFDVLEQFGVICSYDSANHAFLIRRGQPAADHIEIDGRNIPTVVPTIVAVAPFIEAAVTMRNAAHVNNHKSRRLQLMITELNRLGCTINPVYDSDGRLDGFTSAGRQYPMGGATLHSDGDHRVFMSLATAALGARLPSTVDGAENIYASFPEFLDVLNSVGVRRHPGNFDAAVRGISTGEV